VTHETRERHTAADFLAFLRLLARAYPAGEVHVILVADAGVLLVAQREFPLERGLHQLAVEPRSRSPPADTRSCP